MCVYNFWEKLYVWMLSLRPHTKWGGGPFWWLSSIRFRSVEKEIRDNVNIDKTHLKVQSMVL